MFCFVLFCFILTFNSVPLVAAAINLPHQAQDVSRSSLSPLFCSLRSSVFPPLLQIIVDLAQAQERMEEDRSRRVPLSNPKMKKRFEKRPNFTFPNFPTSPETIDVDEDEGLLSLSLLFFFMFFSFLVLFCFVFLLFCN